MDKMALIVHNGSSGPTHRMRVGDKRKAKIDILMFFLIKYPHTLATTTTTDTPGGVPETMAPVGGDPNLFVHTYSKYIHTHPFSVQIWAKSRRVWPRHRLSPGCPTSMPEENSG